MTASGDGRSDPNPNSWRWAGFAVGLALAGCTGEAFFFLLAAVNALAHAAAGRALGLTVALDVGWGPVLVDRTAATGAGWRLRMLPGLFARPGPAFREAPLWRRLVFLGVGPVASTTVGLALAWLGLFAAALHPFERPLPDTRPPVEVIPVDQPGPAPDVPPPTTTIRPTPGEAAGEAVAVLGALSSQVSRVFDGTVAAEPAGGSVAIGSADTSRPTRAIAWLAGLAMLRATLLVTAFNLLPMPWSDGLAAAGEVVWSATGRELPVGYLAAAGAVAVAALAVFVFVSDVARLLAG